MVVLYLNITLHAPWCNSLKDKRSELRKITSGIKRRFNVSVCESSDQDAHRTITLAICALAFHHAQADSIAEEILDFVENLSEAEIVSSEQEYR